MKTINQLNSLRRLIGLQVRKGVGTGSQLLTISRQNITFNSVGTNRTLWIGFQGHIGVTKDHSDLWINTQQGWVRFIDVDFKSLN